MSGLVAAIASLVTAIGLALGSYAAVKARRTEARSATREEIQQALDTYEKLLSRVDSTNTRLEASVETLTGRAAVAEARHRRCEEELDTVLARLDALEAKGG